jgi:hypothetical protein
MKRDLPVRSLLVYTVFIFIAASGMIYVSSIRGIYDNLRIWTLTDLLILLAGLPFIFLQSHAGLPPFEGKAGTGKKLWIIPLATGIFFGILDVLVFRVINAPQPSAGLPPYLQPFPYSVFLFFSGAFEIEIFYRMIPLTIICLAGKYIAKGKYFNTFFWAAAILTSLREPLEQMPSGSVSLVVYSLATGFAMNLLQAYWYRKNGFTASLILRLGHYLIWHILLGIWVEFIELQY